MNSVENSSGGARIAFGDFRLDAVQRRLWRSDGTPVALSPRLFDALVFFVEHAGELLDKERLLSALWPSQVVEENNLNQTVLALRRALGDDGSAHRYLLTVPRRGFRFVAEVRAVTSDAPSPRSAGAAAQARNRRALMAGGTAASALGAGAMVWQRHRENQSGSDAQPSTTLAVLPFKTLGSARRRDEILELGMADSLIARLSSARGVIVRSVASVRTYVGHDTDPVRAARDLGVAWVLDGTIQQADGQIRVTARLLRVSDGTAAWSGSFDERFTDVFDVQDTVSRRVAAILVPQLSEHERGGLTTAGTRNSEAYHLYLEARYQSLQFTPDAYRRALTLYQQAIAADPNYAQAHIGLADLHRRTIYTSNATPRVALEAARSAAGRALELDPALGDAHAIAGWVAYLYAWDWNGAERRFVRAQELNPSLADAHSGRGHVLLTTGRAAMALAHFERAREVDPTSPLALALEGGSLAALGRTQDAVERIQRALRINPQFWIAHLFLGNVLSARGEAVPALESLRRAAELSRGSAWAIGPLGHALAQAGRVDEARALLADFVGRTQSGYVPPSFVALVHIGLGDVGRALDWLETAHEARDVRLVYLRFDHRWAPLRREPRFIALAQKLGLDATQPEHPCPL